MLDVQQSHTDIDRVVAKHQIPELLRSSYVEYLDMTFQGSQQRQKKLEPTTPHPRRQRPAVAVVGDASYE